MLKSFDDDVKKLMKDDVIDFFREIGLAGFDFEIGNSELVVEGDEFGFGEIFGLGDDFGKDIGMDVSFLFDVGEAGLAVEEIFDDQ